MTGGTLRHRGDEQHLLREIMRTHQVMMASFVRNMGRPASHFAAMRLLANAQKGLGVMEIAETLGINAAAVTRTVKELETEKLIRRRADPRDGRRHYVILTPKGMALFSDIHERSHRLERQLVAEIGTGEIAVTVASLAKLRTIIEELHQDDRNGTTPSL